MLDPHKDEPGGTGLGLDRSQSISLEAPTRYSVASRPDCFSDVESNLLGSLRRLACCLLLGLLLLENNPCQNELF